MIMMKANCIPTEYTCLEQPEQPACNSPFYFATEENGWTVTRYDNFDQGTQDETDIRDSLESLKEPTGIGLDDLRQELDV
jgi:hypothetical protein